MEQNNTPANRFNELPSETQVFLLQLRVDDIETLKDGLRLVMAMHTVGKFVKCLIVMLVGSFIGTVMLYENVMKIINWLLGAK